MGSLPILEISERGTEGGGGGKSGYFFLLLFEGPPIKATPANYSGLGLSVNNREF